MKVPKNFVKIFVSFLTLCSLSSQVSSIDLDNTIFEKVGFEKNLDPKLLYAIALAESAYSPVRNSSSVAPYPWTLRTPAEPIYAHSFDEAKETLETLLKCNDRVDVGLMQINIHWHKNRVNKPEELLDPVTNLRVGADILNELFQKYPHDLIGAIGSYHSRTTDRKEKYGLIVFHIYNQLD